MAGRPDEPRAGGNSSSSSGRARWWRSLAVSSRRQGRRFSTWREPADSEIRLAMTPEVDAVMVISRDDRVSLRHALVVEHMRPGVAPDSLTVYNRDLGGRVGDARFQRRVMSMADVVAPSLAAACPGGGSALGPTLCRHGCRDPAGRRRPCHFTTGIARSPPRRAPCDQPQIDLSPLRAERQDNVVRVAGVRVHPP